MNAVITRVTFSRSRVTLYDTNGVFAIWDGWRAKMFSDMLVGSVKHVLAAEKAEAQNATREVEIKEGGIGEHQTGDGGGETAEAGDCDSDVRPAESEVEETPLTPI